VAVFAAPLPTADRAGQKGLQLTDDARWHGERDEALEAQAQAWVRRMKSGAARKADAQALQRWCQASEAQAAAFRRAAAQWRALGPAAALAGEGDAELAALRSARRPAASTLRKPLLQRRAFLGSAVAATVAGVAVAMDPPLGLWPSAQALRADYRTGTGQQQRVAVSADATVVMNTRSSLRLLTSDGERRGIDLIEGEVAVELAASSQPFTVTAGAGLIEGRGARFEVRHIDGRVCVTCLQGRLQLSLAGRELGLGAEEQVEYQGQSTLPVRTVDAVAQSNWRQGVLSFQKTALAQVVAEINRYRPGRVLLLGRKWDAQPVSGRFQIADLDKAIAQIQRLFRLEATSLPGAIVILR